MKKIICNLKTLLLLVLITAGAVIEMQAQVFVRRPGGVAVVGRPAAGFYYGPRVYGAGVIVTGVPAYCTVTYASSTPRYYYKDGVYYERTDNAAGVNPEDIQPESNEPVLPPVGTIVPSLPDGAQKTQVDGNSYFEYDNVQYKEVIVDNTVKYEIAAYTTPSDKKNKKKNKK